MRKKILLKVMLIFAAITIILIPLVPLSHDVFAACTPGQSKTCGSNTGACTFGVQTCRSNGEWGTCNGGIKPIPETCNFIDDNCNGFVDEGNICLSTLKPACKEDWNCSEWLPCFNANRTGRVCEDMNGCNTLQNKPVTEKPCVSESFFDEVQKATTTTAKNIIVLAKDETLFLYSVVMLIVIFMFLAWVISIDRTGKKAVVQSGEKNE